jgi:FtsP/CotA-like multicopper oxidase with cupredoxin domain
MALAEISRRKFLVTAGAVAGVSALRPLSFYGASPSVLAQPDYASRLHSTIATKPIELAPKHIVSVTTYNGQFPGPLLRFKEGQRVTVDVHNETDVPEQLHWHGQAIPSDVDGAAEEGTPLIAPHGSRRISFVPKPFGFRFYHTHVRAGSDLSRGQYSGLVGPVYIEPRSNHGNYDREVFLTLKEFEPTFSRGGDMDMDFLSPAATVESLKDAGESTMHASLAKGMPKGYEVG